jgi:UDP:flavonoid glycosyltransferase YjiC (YdhE family)
MRAVILTLGTRGDVQPYLALGRGLQACGHTVTLATTGEFEDLVGEYGLAFAPLRGDFLKAAQSREGRGNFLKLVRQWIAMARETLDDEWQRAKEAEVFIYNPAALGGYHIAEKLGVPSFAAFPTPLYTPTREFPSPFFPVASLGPFNRASHRLLAKMGPALYGQPIREWRREVLGLPPARGETTLRGRPVPMLYGYSEAVVPRPADWDESAVVTGYWFLDAPAGWQPPEGLARFLASGPPPVYVGFGSMFMAGGAEKTRLVLKALALAGQRGVLATGWGGMAAEGATDNVYFVDEAPHDWLFPQVAAVVHHGGAGTTGAGLRAGRPTVICPLVGDQPFWGRRVAALGAGPAPMSPLRLTPERLAAAITTAVTDGGMRDRAAALGERLRLEDGVGRAADFVERHLAKA